MSEIVWYKPSSKKGIQSPPKNPQKAKEKLDGLDRFLSRPNFSRIVGRIPRFPYQGKPFKISMLMMHMIVSLLISFVDPHVRELYRDQVINLDSIFLTIADGWNVLRQTITEGILHKMGFKPFLISISVIGGARILLNQEGLDKKVFKHLKEQILSQDSPKEMQIIYNAHGIPFNIQRRYHLDNNPKEIEPKSVKKATRHMEGEKAVSTIRERQRIEIEEDMKNLSDVDRYIQTPANLTDCQQKLITVLEKRLDRAEIMDLLHYFQNQHLSAADLTRYLKKKVVELKDSP